MASTPTLDHSESSTSSVLLQLRVWKFVSCSVPNHTLGAEQLRFFKTQNSIVSALKQSFEELNSFFGVGFFKPDLILAADFDPLWEQVQRENTASDIGDIYSQFLTPTTAKRGGIFYTPKALARKVILEAIERRQTNSDISSQMILLDPACGCGVFLVTALLELVRIMGELPQMILEEMIFGLDFDPLAIELCRINLLLALVENGEVEPSALATTRSNLACGNFLVEPADCEAENHQIEAALKPVDIERTFPEIHTRGGCDFIVGNPPYGLARGAQISNEENTILKSKYAHVRRGKVNKYLLFLARSYELLRSHGVLSMIVPNAWLGIDGGAQVRRLLVASGALRKLSILPPQTFRKLGVEVVIAQAQKTRMNGLADIEIETIEHGLEIPAKIVRFPIHQAKPETDYQIPLTWSEDLAKVCKHLDEVSIPLGDSNSPFMPLIALQAYAIGKGTPAQTAMDVSNHIFHSDSPTPVSLPYLEGRELYRYAVGIPKRHLRMGPWLAENQPRSRYTDPRVVLREITSPQPYLVTAAYLEDPYVYNRSILHILCRSECPQTMRPELLLSLCGILNSRFISAVLSYSGQKCQRSLFPKLVHRDLKRLPIPKVFPAEGIGQIVRTLQEYTAQLNSDDRRAIWNHPTSNHDSSLGKQIRLAQAELDQSVYRAFGLTPQMVETLERMLIKTK